MTKHPFKHILMIGRPHVPGVPETLTTLKDFLLSLKRAVSIEEHTASCIDDHDIPICDNQNIPDSIDLIIVVGGDGSLLNAAHIAVEHDLPIIGVHRGRLGFLTDIHPSQINLLKPILDGDYLPERRFFLEAKLHRSDRIITDIALNDVVLMPGEAPQMIEYEIIINDDFVCKQRSDGLIISTPTGSTAYALSAGGPIIKPGLDAVSIVPICPHTLNSRPLVVCSKSHISLRITENNKNNINVSCDGIDHITVNSGDHIDIAPFEKQLIFIHPKDYNYFTTLREKLYWEKHAERT